MNNDEQQQKPKRSAVAQKRLRNRKINHITSLVWISLSGLAVVGILVLFFMGYFQSLATYITHSLQSIQPALGFKVQEVIIQGRQKIQLETLKSKMPMTIGDPISKYAIDDIRSSIQEIEWVKECTVYRQLPDQFYITIQERHPIARWHVKDKTYLIDDYGIAIPVENEKEYLDLPMFYGHGAPAKAKEILTLFKDFPKLKDHITSIVRINHRRWDFVLSDSIIIKLPEEFKNEKIFKDALTQLQDLIDKKRLLPERIQSVDLRIEGKQYIKKRVNETKENAHVDKTKIHESRP